MLLGYNFQITQCSAQIKVLGSNHNLDFKKDLDQNPKLSLTTVIYPSPVIYNPSLTTLK